MQPVQGGGFLIVLYFGPWRMGVTENQPIKSHRLSAGSSPGWDKGCVTLSKDKHHF